MVEKPSLRVPTIAYATFSVQKEIQTLALRRLYAMRLPMRALSQMYQGSYQDALLLDLARRAIKATQPIVLSREKGKKSTFSGLIQRPLVRWNHLV
jgi:hypothetical protein